VPKVRTPQVAQNMCCSVRVLQRYSLSAAAPSSRRKAARGTIAAQLRCLVHSVQLHTRVAVDGAGGQVDLGLEAHCAAVAAAPVQARRHDQWEAGADDPATTGSSTKLL
jgi:hypothetical protein